MMKIISLFLIMCFACNSYALKHVVHKFEISKDELNELLFFKVLREKTPETIEFHSDFIKNKDELKNIFMKWKITQEKSKLVVNIQSSVKKINFKKFWVGFGAGTLCTSVFALGLMLKYKNK